MKTVAVDGSKLRSAVHAGGFTQRELAEKIGVTHFTVSRLCQRGSHDIMLSNAEKIAACIGVPIAAFAAMPGDGNKGGDWLTPAESDFLNAFKSLTPLDQARARIQLEALIQDCRKATR
jgi:transcriptional regulator with XRE-family HTH domain